MQKNRFYPSNGDAQSQIACARCRICLGEVYPDDLVHRIDGFIICPECFADFTFDYFSGCLMTGRDILEEYLHDDD